MLLGIGTLPRPVLARSGDFRIGRIAKSSWSSSMSLCVASGCWVSGISDTSSAIAFFPAGFLPRRAAGGSGSTSTTTFLGRPRAPLAFAAGGVSVTVSVASVMTVSSSSAPAVAAGLRPRPRPGPFADDAVVALPPLFVLRPAVASSTAAAAAAATRSLAPRFEVDVFGAGLVTRFAGWRPALAFFRGMVFCDLVDGRATSNSSPPIPSSKSESTNCNR